MRKFWMVVGRGVPCVKHDSEQSARAEASRLAKNNPGEPFTVLESIATACKVEVQWTDHISNDEYFGPPF